MTTMHHEFGDRAPSVPQLHGMLRKDAKAGATVVIFERGEQYSKFELHGDRWIHFGNGLLKAGYKLGNALDTDWTVARRTDTAFKL